VVERYEGKILDHAAGVNGGGVDELGTLDDGFSEISNKAPVKAPLMLILIRLDNGFTNTAEPQPK
jgi:hypothetical protein